MKTIEKLFGASVAVVSLTTLITTVTGLVGLSLPRWALWLSGILNLICLPLLIYSAVKSLREKCAAARKLGKKAAGKAPLKAAEPTGEESAPAHIPVKVRPKPDARQLAAKKASSGNKPKKGKKKKK